MATFSLSLRWPLNTGLLCQYIISMIVLYLVKQVNTVSIYYIYDHLHFTEKTNFKKIHKLCLWILNLFVRRLGIAICESLYTHTLSTKHETGEKCSANKASHILPFLTLVQIHFIQSNLLMWSPVLSSHLYFTGHIIHILQKMSMNIKFICTRVRNCNMWVFVYTYLSMNTVKPVLGGHLQDKEKTPFIEWILNVILCCTILMFTYEQVFKKLGSFIEECFLLRGHNWSYRYH
jgi:hypothetical protein